MENIITHTKGETMDNRNEELHDFAARKRAEWTENATGLAAANKRHADERSLINSRFADLVLGGMDWTAAGDLIRKDLGRPNMLIDAEEDANGRDDHDWLRQQWT